MMSTSVDEAIANFYPEATLFPPSASDFASNNGWVSHTDFQSDFQSEVTHTEYPAKKSKEVQSQHSLVFAMPQVEIFDDQMDAFPNFEESMNHGLETTFTTLSNRRDASIVRVSGFDWEQTEYSEGAAEKEAADNNNSAPSSSEGTRSCSPQSEDGSETKGLKRHARPWTEDEHAVFLAALEKFRTNKTEKFKRNGKQTAGLGPGIADLIALIIKTRDAAQVRSHAQKHFQRLRREGKTQGSHSA